MSQIKNLLINIAGKLRGVVSAPKPDLILYIILKGKK